MANFSLFKPSQSGRIFYLGSIIIALLFVAIYFSSLDIEGAPGKILNQVESHNYKSRSSIYHYYDSDALWTVSFCKGVLNDRCFKYWNIGTCPNLFPSFIIFFLLASVIKSVLIIQLINAFIQFFLLIIMINILYRTILPNISLFALSISNVLLTLLLIWPLYLSDVLINTNLFLPYHFGAFFNALLASILALRFLKTAKYSYLLWFGVVVILAFFSNKIFMVYFALPFIVSLILYINSEHTRKILIIIGVTVFSLFIGWLFFRAMIIYSTFAITPSPINPGNIKQSYFLALNQLKSFIVMNSLRRYVFSLIFVSIILTFLAALYLSLKNIFDLISRKTQKWNSIKFYTIFCSVLIAGSFAAPILRGIYYHEWNIRYFIYPFFLALTNLGLFVGFFLFKNYQNLVKYASISLITILLVYFLLIYNSYRPFAIFSRINSYYSGIVKATDNLSVKYPLKNGVGDHWDSKHISQLSKKGVKVHTIFNNLYLWFHGNNKMLTLYEDCNLNDTAFFNFIVLRMLGDTTHICNFFDNNIIRITQDEYKFYLVPDFYYERNTGIPKITNKNVFLNSE